ncbi:MAG: DsbA family protein [Tannerellaceae bacterium]|nr:DsbA family protein [Tannerellaceae bacterium]
MNTYLHINNTDHVQGSNDATIELIEYADYQCPYCRKAYYIIKEAQKELGDQLKLVFRNFPLVELHPNALNAAFAAEAAADQDKFWEMHDMLFENQSYLEESDLIGYAEQLKLDMRKFTDDLGQDRFYQKIQKDYDSGLRVQVQGTPTFFVNGQPFEGNWMSHEFIEYMQRMGSEMYK